MSRVTDVSRLRMAMALRMAAAVAVSAALVVHQRYVALVHPDVPYMDSLRLLYHLDLWEAGRMRLLDMWGFGTSSHRGLVTQAFLFANMHGFGLDALLANRATGFVIATVSALLAFAFARDAMRAAAGQWTRARRAVALLTVALLAVLGFSFAGFELLTLDLGLPLWFKNLAFVGYFAAHGAFLVRPSRARALALSLAGIWIVLLIAMGWAYAFVGAVVFVQALDMAARWPKRPHFVEVAPSVALVAALGVYFLAGGGAGDGVSAPHVLRSLVDTAKLMLYAAGAGAVGADALRAHALPEILALGAGALFAAAAILFTWRRVGREFATTSLLPLYLVAYGGLVSVSVSIARGDGGISAVMASRYYMDVYLLAVGALWLCADALLRTRPGHRSPQAIAWGALAAVLVAGYCIDFATEQRTAPYRAAAFQAMAAATRADVVDEDAARLLQSPYDNAVRGIAVMRRRQLGPFRTSPLAECSDTAIQRGIGWHGAEPGGVWMRATAELTVPACQCPLHATLYIPADFSARTVSVEAAGGVVGQLVLRPGEPAVLDLPPARQVTRYRVRSSAVTVPSRDLGRADIRDLGVLWSATAFACKAR